MTGPGDDILDAIEAGKDDDALMKQFKINTDQVNSFRSLYYGLTNRKVKYGEIKDYYPELKTYFTSATPAAQETPEATAMPKEDFTKLPKQKMASESTARMTMPAPKATGPSKQEVLDKKLQESQLTLQNELGANDDVVEKMIRNQRYA